VIDCNEWRTEKRQECANMGKVKRLVLWWQLYRTSLPVWDLENFRPMDFCWHECTNHLSEYGVRRCPNSHGMLKLQYAGPCQRDIQFALPICFWSVYNLNQKIISVILKKIGSYLGENIASPQQYNRPCSALAWSLLPQVLTYGWQSTILPLIVPHT